MRQIDIFDRVIHLLLHLADLVLVQVQFLRVSEHTQIRNRLHPRVLQHHHRDLLVNYVHRRRFRGVETLDIPASGDVQIFLLGVLISELLALYIFGTNHFDVDASALTSAVASKISISKYRRWTIPSP